MSWLSTLSLVLTSAILTVFNGLTSPSDFFAEILFGASLSIFLVSLLWTPNSSEKRRVVRTHREMQSKKF